MNPDLDVTYYTSDYLDFDEGTIESAHFDEARVTVDFDLSCALSGTHCQRGTSPVSTDARTYVEVDTQPIADAGESIALGVVAAVVAHGLLVIARDFAGRRGFGG